MKSMGPIDELMLQESPGETANICGTMRVKRAPYNQWKQWVDKLFLNTP